MPVVMLHRDSIDFNHHSDMTVQEGYDDLDYLSFVLLTLPSSRQVALVHHKRAPVQGIELCVDPYETQIINIINETMQFLNLSLKDILWVHPDFEKGVDALAEAKQ
jgi:hypothetical protein